MNVLIEPHRQVLKKLIEHKVDFILIRGYAVNFHGYNRVTGDMDVWLKPDNGNRDKFLAYLTNEGFNDCSINHIKGTDFTNHAIFHIGEKPLQVEFLTKISGITLRTLNQEKKHCPFKILKYHF